MSPDALTLLRDRDPAATIDATPDDALLATLLATPRPAPRPRRRLPRPAVGLAGAVTAAVAVAAIALTVGFGGAGGGVPDLAARAYAQTAPTGGILHVRTRWTFTTDDPRGPHDAPVVDERWTLGRRSHAISGRLRDGRLTGVFENVVDAANVLRIRDEHGTVTTSQVRDRFPDFVTQFRTAYRRGRLDATGTATFAGRPARTYVDDLYDRHGAGRGEPAATVHVHAVYFLDAQTGTPLGSRETQLTTLVGGRRVTSVSTTTVEALDHLPDTPQNEQLLEFTKR